MKTNFNYLSYLSLGFGATSFLFGLIPFIMFMSFIAQIFNFLSWNIYILDTTAEWYLGLMSSRGNNIILFIISISLLLGLSTFFIGFMAIIYIEDKSKRGISFLGNILGLVGIIGNLISFILYFIPSY